MTGEKTSVHKPLLSAGDVTDKGHALWLDGNVGYIIQKDSPILTAMRTSTSKRLAAMATLGKQLMSSPNEMEVDESGHRESGGFRQVESVRQRELSVPSDGGEEAIAPRVPPVPAKPTQGRAG